MTEPEIREFMMSNIARHKVPRYIKFVESYPMNAAGKILKYKMRRPPSRSWPSEPGEEVAASIHRHSAGAV